MTDAVERLNTALADRYRITRELGSGGMARVYLAEDIKHDRLVALKVFRPELAAVIGPERFLREVKIAANLQHPHILPLHDSGQEDGILYFVMPYVEGTTLRQKLASEGELPVSEAVRILRDIADALAYAHRHGVVHRDIKPENVMLSDRHALVMDFGVARAVGEAADSQSLTTAGVAIGTPMYMAPEQAAAQANTDHRADLYAFGVVAYELLTGRPPFIAPSTQAILAAHLTIPAEPVTKYRVNVSPALSDLVMVCLEKRPADRWQTAEQLMAQLESIHTVGGGGASTDKTVVTRKGLRGRTLGLALAAVAVTVAAALAFRTTGSGSDELQRIVVLPLENRTGDPSWDNLSSLTSEYLTQSLLQTGLVQVVPASTAGQVGNALQGREDRSGRTLAQRIASATGAVLAISGGYYQENDSIRFALELTDGPGGKLLYSPDPVRASTRDPMPGVERLRGLLSARVALQVNPGSKRWADLGQVPPSYEVLKVMGEARAAMSRREFAEAIGFYRRAFEMDSTFEAARYHQAVAYMNLQDWDAADSLAALSERNVQRLGWGERWALTWLRATLRGDEQAAYRIVKEGLQRIYTQNNLRQLAGEAQHTNRPRESLTILSELERTTPDPTGSWFYWALVTRAHHMLGDHERELVSARKARNRNSELLSTLALELHALAALHRATEVNPLLDTSLTLAPQPEFSPARLARESGLELYTHGDTVAAERIFARAVTWYQELPESERSADLMGYAEALYYARDYATARGVIPEACRQDPSTVPCLGLAGLVAARMGQRDSALALLNAIGRTDSTPRKRISYQAFAQARIAAALGDQESAVSHLRRALAHGYEEHHQTHSTYDFHDLLNYAPFRTLIKPKE